MTLGSYKIQFEDHYCVWLVAFVLIIRGFIGVLRTWELCSLPKKDLTKEEKERFIPPLSGNIILLWVDDVLSRSCSARVKDFFHPTILGLFELIVYPPLISTLNWHPIAAWLTLKTAAQWTEWKANRKSYQRFLIGNALVIIAAIWLATMVHVTQS